MRLQIQETLKLHFFFYITHTNFTVGRLIQGFNDVWFPTYYVYLPYNTQQVVNGCCYDFAKPVDKTLWINDTVCFYNTTSFRQIQLIALTLTRSRTSENSGLLRVLRGRAGQRARISVVRGGKCLIKRYGSKVSQSSSTLEHWLTMLPCNKSHGLSQLLERKGRTAGLHLIYY